MSAVSVAIPKGEIKDVLKYIGIFLAIVLAIFIAYRLYKKFLNVGRDVNAVADAIEDKALDNKISKDEGIPVQDVEAARVIAKHLGVNLETDKDMSTMDKLTHIQWDSETIEILGRVKSSSQMALVANFYKNKVTNGNPSVLHCSSLVMLNLYIPSKEVLKVTCPSGMLSGLDVFAQINVVKEDVGVIFMLDNKSLQLITDAVDWYSRK